jgi:hypothetical protein
MEKGEIWYVRREEVKRYYAVFCWWCHRSGEHVVYLGGHIKHPNGKETGRNVLIPLEQIYEARK